MKIKGDFIKNEELLYTDTTNPEAEEYYVYECEIEDSKNENIICTAKIRYILKNQTILKNF